MTSVPKEGQKICRLCETDLIPGFAKEHQRLLTVQTNRLELSAHFFCLAFSSGLGQRGEETEGLQGFLSSDVLNELKRGSRLKCVYCKKKGATVGCARPQCKKSYHLPCGLANNSLQQYYDQFKSYCSSHRPVQKVKHVGSSRSLGKTDLCSICQEEVSVTTSPKSIWTPCCGAFFHPACIQSTALSAGAFHFRCPLCNNDKRFVSEMKQFGIYVPEQDAAWEDSNTDSAASVEKPPECRAKICFCEKQGQDHRQYDCSDSSWEILGCYSCGFKGIHARCGGMDEYVDPQWYCYTCRRLESTKPTKDKNANRPIVAIWGTAAAKKPERETYLEATPIAVASKAMSLSQLSAVVESSSTSMETNEAIPNDVPKEFRLKVPVKRSSSDLMTLTLEEIIVKGLDEKLRETNYRSKIYANASPQSEDVINNVTLSQTTSKQTVGVTFSVPVTKSDEKSRHKSQDSSNSPGDSDYESAQEATIPFKIRKKSPSEPQKGSFGSSVTPPTPPSVVIRKTGPVSNGFAHERKLHLNQSDFIDQKIQNSIKEFFRESSSSQQ